MRRLLLVVLLAMGVFAGEARAADRYALAGGCYALKSVATGKFVAKAADGGYRASAGGAGGAEPFRMQATTLGRYLLYGAKRDFMGVGKPSPIPVATPDQPAAGARAAGLHHHAARRPRAERRRPRARPPTGA